MPRGGPGPPVGTRRWPRRVGGTFPIFGGPLASASPFVHVPFSHIPRTGHAGGAQASLPRVCVRVFTNWRLIADNLLVWGVWVVWVCGAGAHIRSRFTCSLELEDKTA